MIRGCNHILSNLSIVVVLAIFCFNCDSDDNCEEGYVQQYGPEGSTFCIPEFEEGVLHDFELGGRYFHEKYGVIQFDNGIWKNQSNQVTLP